MARCNALCICCTTQWQLKTLNISRDIHIVDSLQFIAVTMGFQILMMQCLCLLSVCVCLCVCGVCMVLSPGMGRAILF